ncbi:hypothetical protein [Jannaschia sp. LMIT008]|uniref:COG3904 family protein n=1 Tax=Jannaschia maritima TaxID=3032585 RepID=UPI002811F86D|nr:hypothetical protein [Jannaschia sp. LMIT008]
MSAADGPTPAPERRTLRWLLGAQIAIAVLLVVVELVPTLPRLLNPSAAPELDRPTRPGDQTRRYRMDVPTRTGPADMPRRLTAEPVQADGADGLALRGDIAPGDGDRIVAALLEGDPAFVTLDSPGGSVSDALLIGRTVRAEGIATIVRDGAVCMSACPYILAGGVRRTAGDDARIGVHQHSFGESTILPAFLAVEDIQRGQAQVLDHLTEMGIDLRIMGPALATPAAEIYILSQGELRDWNVVTE